VEDFPRGEPADHQIPRDLMAVGVKYPPDCFKRGYKQEYGREAWEMHRAATHAA
jgi:hypothetical protein